MYKFVLTVWILVIYITNVYVTMRLKHDLMLPAIDHSCVSNETYQYHIGRTV